MSAEHENRNIAIIDDDRLFCDATRQFLQKPGRAIFAAHSGKGGLGICESRRIDVVLLDKNLPDVEGHTLCPEILEINDQTKIIYITAHPSFDSAVEALRAGAHEYLSKPFEPEALSLAVDKAIRTLDLEDVEQLAQYRNQKERMGVVIVGGDAGLAQVVELMEFAAQAEAPVLLTGETGTGKNVAAKAIHYASRRKDRPFVTVNCGALPENLIEAELFGYEKGAYTGATAARRGLFEMASGGTLFLDEVGEMPMHLQVKLLGVLEDNELRRLGGETSRPIDLHVIAATSADLETALGQTFRRDLYFRLSVMAINMPRLREHPEDIAALVDHFLADMLGARKPAVSAAEVERLAAYDWPGNVRELRNVLERAVIVQRDGRFEPSRLLGGALSTGPDIAVEAGTDEQVRPLSEVEKEHVRFALAKMDHNLTHTADALGIAISTLKRKIRKYGLGRGGPG